MTMSQPSQSVSCPRCGKHWSATTEICPDDGTRLHALIAGHSLLDANTVIDAPFNGSLTELADVSAVRATGSMNLHAGSQTQPSIGPLPLRKRAITGELTPATRVGEYVIEGKIGEGAMGAVYRAVHPTIGKHVAVKIMNSKLCGDPTAVERFTREARAVAAVRHPGIVDVFGFGTLDDGHAYLVMEWLDGVNLGERLGQGPLNLEDALDVIAQIARALEAAHDKGITHRDLKPDNVFLEHVPGERAVIKILDFGLAKLAHEDAAMTQTGQLLGTPVYMSPEQCKGKGVDHRTDIYALGCIAYALICGRVPFDADNTAELIAAHLSEQPPLPRSLWSEIPVELDELLFAMLAKDPAQRPTLRQVRRTLAMVGGTAYPTPVPGQLRAVSLSVAEHVPRRRIALRHVIVVVALVLAGAGIGAFTRRSVSNVRAPVTESSAPADARVEQPADAVTVVPSLAVPSPAIQPVLPELPSTSAAVKKVRPVKPAHEKPAVVEKPAVDVIDQRGSASSTDPATRTINPFKKKKTSP